MSQEMFEFFENGNLTIGANSKNISTIAWSEHKDFPGVFLKNVIMGDQTEGLFTCHLVRIDPNCKIGLHTHPTSIELHEVIAGSGVCVTECGQTPYRPGNVAVLARNAPHEVRAGEEGLRLFAKFVTTPAQSSPA